MKRIVVVTLAFVLTGCSAGLIDMRGVSHSAYAPINEGERPGGIVKLECGTSTIQSIIKSCEKKGERMMRDFCGGAFQVTRKSGTLNGRVEYEQVQVGSVHGHAITESVPKESTNEFVFFDCLKGSDASKD